MLTHIVTYGARYAPKYVRPLARIFVGDCTISQMNELAEYLKENSFDVTQLCWSVVALEGNIDVRGRYEGMPEVDLEQELLAYMERYKEEQV